jgi:hypothetical protein
MNLDANGKIIEGEGNLYIDTDTKYPESTETKQFVRIAEVTIDNDSAGGKYISYILNNCKTVEPDTLPLGGSGGTCPFKLTDASDDEGLKVQVAWGMIGGLLPTGMFPDNNPPLIMPVEPPEYVYAHCTYAPADPGGYMQLKSVDFVLDSDPKPATTTEVWYPVGHVSANEAHTALNITNVCTPVTTSVCDLAWSPPT